MSKSDVVRKERILYAVLGVAVLGFCIYVYEELFSGGSSTPTPVQTIAVSDTPTAASPNGGVVVGGPAAKKVGTTSARLDPTLHMQAMLVSEAVAYSGTGRNIFSQTSVPVVPIPRPIAPARPVQTSQYIPQQPTGPPPPPPIDLKFFGVQTQPNGRCDQMQCKAFLLHDDSVFIATGGDVVMRRYKVIAVDAKSVQVEDMQNNNRQTLPLLVN